MRKFEGSKMECDCCHNMVEETTTASCAIGGIEVNDILPNLEKERANKLCSWEDQFFCKDCMDGNICKECAHVLSLEEKEIIKNYLD